MTYAWQEDFIAELQRPVLLFRDVLIHSEQLQIIYLKQQVVFFE